jgi:hypothetical protein
VIFQSVIWLNMLDLSLAEMMTKTGRLCAVYTLS